MTKWSVIPKDWTRIGELDTWVINPPILGLYHFLQFTYESYYSQIHFLQRSHVSSSFIANVEPYLNTYEPSVNTNFMLFLQNVGNVGGWALGQIWI